MASQFPQFAESTHGTTVGHANPNATEWVCDRYPNECDHPQIEWTGLRACLRCQSLRGACCLGTGCNDCSQCAAASSFCSHSKWRMANRSGARYGGSRGRSSRRTASRKEAPFTSMASRTGSADAIATVGPKALTEEETPTQSTGGPPAVWSCPGVKEGDTSPNDSPPMPAVSDSAATPSRSYPSPFAEADAKALLAARRQGYQRP